MLSGCRAKMVARIASHLASWHRVTPERVTPDPRPCCHSATTPSQDVALGAGRDSKPADKTAVRALKRLQALLPWDQSILDASDAECIETVASAISLMGESAAIATAQ